MTELWSLLFFVVAVLSGVKRIKGYAETDHVEDCPSSDNESILKAGYEYSYHFQAEAVGAAVGTTNDKTKMILDCNVKISHQRDCLYKLKMLHCTLTASGGPPGAETAWIDQQLLTELSRHPLMFTLDNGKVKHVYAEQNDALFWVNIKRGALSAFVFKLSATSSALKEMHTDVHGTCPWKSNPVEGENGQVKASKDMLNCAFPSRPDWQLSPWSVFWNMSFIQYVINSTTDCEYNVNVEERRLDRVSCRERHAIMLESTHRTTTAVQTNIQYTVEHLNSRRLAERQTDSIPSRKTGIQYEYNSTPDPEVDPGNFLSVSQKMLLDLVETSQEEIRLFSIPMFTDFVSWLRTSTNLLPFVETVTSCSFLSGKLDCSDQIRELSMSYLSDALVQCNTVPCQTAVAYLAENDHLSALYVKFVLFSWSNMHMTKPRLVQEILNICKAKDIRFCWLALGTVIRKYHEDNHISSSQVPSELQTAANYYYDNIGMVCDGFSPSATEYLTDEDKYHHIFTFIKGIGNMGEAYRILVPGGTRQILSCISNNELPNFINIGALEVLHKMNACHNEQSCNYLYRKIIPMLRNSSYDVGIRIGVFRQLMLTPDDYELAEDLAKILKDEESSQLKAYIGDYLRNFVRDHHYKISHSRFIQALMQSLEQYQISLDSLQNYEEVKSHYSSHGGHINLPFMPERLRGFGAKLDISTVFPLYNMLPQSFNANLTMQLFSKVVNLFQIGGFSEGWENIAIIIQKILLDEVNEKQWSVEKLSDILSDIVVVLSQGDAESNEIQHIDKTLVQSIRKIQTMYEASKSNPKAFSDMYIDMFGSTMAFLSSEDLLSLPSKMEDAYELIDQLRNGLTYNTTRVIRVIEAYHQVPTLMGLPLNWTTNATLAISIRSGLQLVYDQEEEESNIELQAKTFLKPSAALTFLNRMVLDFPTVTQIGVQANSSAYTSTEWKIDIEYSDSRNVRKFRLEKPQNSQKVLELFRTNQLIKHDNYEEIADWDIERTSADWCMGERESSIIGVQVCRERSYPRVTHRIKPWVLMAGWCKWRLEIKPYDMGLKSYNLEVLKLPDDSSIKEVKLKFSAPGSSYRREVLVTATKNPSTKEMTFELKVPEVPNFEVSASRTKLIENEELVGYRSVLLLKISSDVKFQLSYNQKDKAEVRQETTADKNKPPKPKRFVTQVQERTVNIETPFNDYRWSRKMHFQEGSVKADVLISYENHHPQWRWLAKILPATFWETDSKAWIQLRTNWKVPAHRGKTTFTRQTISHANTPHSSIELVTNKLIMPGREQVNFNLTKSEIPTGKLLAFANFTYDLWSSASDQTLVKEIRLLNLTVSHKSWALKILNVKGDTNKTLEMTFIRSKMVPKGTGGNDYVGWWSEESKDIFDFKEYKFKLKSDIDYRAVDTAQLVQDEPSFTDGDIPDLGHEYITADIVFSYPRENREESVTFNGKFVTSGIRIYRFQKDFVLYSTYRNLRLDSHSVYRHEGTNVQISHNSEITHTTSETTAFYNLAYVRSRTGNCLDIDFSHAISSHVFDMSTNVSYHCKPEESNLNVLELNMHTYSSYWSMLNTDLKQIIEDVDSETSHESMNFTHPLMKISVTADWTDRGKDHRKNAIFTSLYERIPSMELYLESLKSGNKEIRLDIHNNEETKLIYKRRPFNEFREISVEVEHNDLTESDWHRVVHLHGKIINPYKRIWKGEIDTNFLQKVKQRWQYIKQRILTVGGEISRDPNHPLNNILNPALKMTLAEYIASLRIASKNNMLLALSAAQEAFKSLEPFYKPSSEIFVNIYNELKAISEKVQHVQEKSITVWAFYYFGLHQVLNDGLQNIGDGIFDTPSLFVKDDHWLRFRYQGGEVLYWNSFRTMPVLRIMRSLPENLIEYEPQTSSHHHLAIGNKVAMIFGPLHVYTFDGHYYEFPDYPSSECAYLLAHDFRKSLFSAISTTESLMLLFPEMTIKINSQNEVFINGSTTQQALPIQSKNEKVIVKREGEYLKVWSPSLTVICDGKNLLCTLELNGWNAGGTAGLLGNADGETFNEYMLPNGGIAADVPEMAAAYELSGQAECRDLTPKVKPVVDSESELRCSQAVVNHCSVVKGLQKSFEESCHWDLSKGNDICYSVGALSALCYYKDMLFKSQCRVKTQESEHIRHKLEVVLIINQHSSMFNGGRSTSTKGVESVIDALEQQFRSNGYSNILYSLVGFGGKGVHYHPSVHSIDKNIWVPHRVMVNDVLKTLEFKGNAPINPVRAIKYAAEVLGFDSFDSKMFVIFTKGDQQESSKAELKHIQYYLNKNSITLYTFASYPSIEKGKKVFGVRTDGLMFPSPKKGEAYLDYPRGDLAKLTSATRGSLFLQKFVESNHPSAFFTEFAGEVWAMVRREVQQCRKCRTVRSPWWNFHNECHVVSC